MRNFLPPLVVDTLRDRYLAGVADAEAFFDLHRADEDAVSGALGQSIAMREPVAFSTPAGEYLVTIDYRKLRGRGPGAPEKEFGADGFFQLAVSDSSGGAVLRKALPFQSKMNWRGSKPDVYRQAKRMEEAFGGGIVIDFSNDGYRACTASAAVASRGSRALADRYGTLRPLGQLLSRDFLDCEIGVMDLFFDPEMETAVFGQRSLEGAHLVTTEVMIRR